MHSYRSSTRCPRRLGWLLGAALIAACGDSSLDQKSSAAQAPGDTDQEVTPEWYAQLTVIKHVVGGTNVAADFTIKVTNQCPVPASFPGSETGTAVRVTAGAYQVTEEGPAGYQATYSAGCSGTIAMGESKTCTITNTASSPCPTCRECGNGILEPGEECDDGNQNDYDGCRNNCKLPYCGDGIVDLGEQCDDGNTNDSDGCRNDCTTGCPVCPWCGNGIVEPGEQCDDGNGNNRDECRNDCTLPYCGDGIVDYGEQCDDGNTNNDDGCRNDCTTACPVCPRCGNGIVEPGEQCDDGNQNNYDACRNNCTVPICGDGIVDPGEDCDDGNTNNYDWCRNDCTQPYCGDGIVDPGEQCDDGNQNNYDGCRNDCTPPYCGDGIVDPGEQCDDGNNNDYDACRNDCTAPTCGLTVDKTCQVSPAPTPSYVCTKPIDTLRMIWEGTTAVRVNAWKGAVGSSTLLASMQLVNPGQILTVSGYAGSPLDVYWEVFDAGSGAKLGTSTFHVSCSDENMNGPEDCGKLEGDGKGKVGYLNMWTFAGMSGAGRTLDCGYDGGDVFPTGQSCQATGSTEVTYGYTVHNTGAALSGVTLVDTVLGQVAAPFALATGETRQFVVSAPVVSTLTNEVTAQGILAGGGVCQDSDSLTVTVTPPVGSCADGKPTALTFRYQGGGCTTTNPQGGKFTCSGLGPTTGTVQVIVTRDQTKLTVTPSTQTIPVNGTFEVRRTDTLGAALAADTAFAILQNGVQVQTLSIHTSCSQRLVVGDVFGSLVLVGFTPVP